SRSSIAMGKLSYSRPRRAGVRGMGWRGGPTLADRPGAEPAGPHWIHVPLPGPEPACGSVPDRREGTVRGYRKARHVRAQVGAKVLDLATGAHLDRGC